MALTDDQKASFRLYLGYADQFRDKDTRLESILTAFSPEAESLISSILTTLVTIDAALLEAGTLEAGIRRVDEIWFQEGYVRTNTILKLGRSYVGRLSIIAGVPVNADYFGTMGWPGDSYSSLGRPSSGRGGPYGLG